MALLFVYGTLMRSGANHRVLADVGASFRLEATTKDERTLVDLGPYPALLPRAREDRTRVAGEIWSVPDEALAALDAFEGAPDLFRRERVVSVGSGGEEVEAFVYVLSIPPPRGARPIPSGRYDRRGEVLPHGAAADLSSRCR